MLGPGAGPRPCARKGHMASPPQAVVAALSATPVKSLHLERLPAAEIDADGIRGDRRLFLLDAHGRMVNAKRHGRLQQVRAELDGGEPLTLTLHVPGAGAVSGPVQAGELLESRFYSLRRPAREVVGPFSAVLSEHAGEQLRLVVPADGPSAVDRGREGAVTLVSRASVRALAELAGQDLDPRRFRMSIEVEGVEPFAEDGWVGREVRVGQALLRVVGNVGRCIITSRDPDSGVVDVPTLDLLRELRGPDAGTTEPLALGVHACVLAGGWVRVGDPVVPASERSS